MTGETRYTIDSGRFSGAKWTRAWTVLRQEGEKVVCRSGDYVTSHYPTELFTEAEVGRILEHATKRKEP